MSPFQNLKANLSYKSRSNTYSLFRGKMGPTKPTQQKTWFFFQNRDHVSIKPSVWDGKSFQTKPGWQFFPSQCVFFLMCILKLGEGFCHTCFIWVVAANPTMATRFFRKHNYPISRVRALFRNGAVRKWCKNAIHKNGHLNKANVLDV